MDMKAKGVIAALPAVEPATGQRGPLMGFNTANAVSDALEAAGYKVVHGDELQKLRDSVAALLGIIDGK